MIGNQIAGFFSVGAPPVPASNFESIATVTVGSGGSSSITFSSIPNTFKHLQVRYIAAAASSGSLVMKLNSDSTTTNYSSHYLFGTGSVAVAGGGSSRIGDFGSLPTASTFGAGVIDILDYSSTVKNKVSRALAGYDANGSGGLGLDSQNWMNSSTAVSTVTFTLDNATNIAQYSSFALYGITGA